MFNPKIHQNSQNTSRLVNSFKREFQKRLDVAKNTKLNQFSYENRIRYGNIYTHRITYAHNTSQTAHSHKIHKVMMFPC